MEKIFIHRKYHIPNLFSNDLALLKLTQTASLSHGTGLVCLPNKLLPLPVGESCWVTGWGYTDIAADPTRKTQTRPDSLGSEGQMRR